MPRTWREQWEAIESRLSSPRPILLALGLDGILWHETSAASGNSGVPEDTRALLLKLAASPRLRLGLLSGRPLPLLQKLIGIPNAYYAGNSGMEVRGPGLSSSDGIAVSCRSDLVDALTYLARCTKGLRGVFIQDKKLSISVHWRAGDLGEEATLRELMGAIVQAHPRLKLFAPRGCFELRPRASWNQREALAQITAHAGISPADAIYMGDELTEDEAIAPDREGLTLSVGNTPGACRFRLPHVEAAGQILFCVLCAISGMPPK